ncbi:MAG: hypothetical protein J4F49_12760 [Rhodobacteraceae bacterium]|nr:hypothetical protein [Paracoccaceae bacterium]
MPDSGLNSVLKALSRRASRVAGLEIAGKVSGVSGKRAMNGNPALSVLRSAYSFRNWRISYD